MHPLHHWLGATKEQRQAAITQLFTEKWGPRHDYIRLVKAPGNWGIFASIGPHYHYAIFGRDSIETAEDIMDTHPDTVREIILAMCRLQGMKFDRISEEEPGKIHHEYRALHLNGFTIPDYSQQIFRQIQRERDMQGSDEMTYYGSCDATPLFIRLVGRYAEKHGKHILAESFRHRDGHIGKVVDSVTAALTWLTDKLAAHPLNLLAYKRLNPDGIANQIWKDSGTSHLHADGSLPNFEGGIASIELQGLAYDALKTGVALKLGSHTEQAAWEELAYQIQRHVLADFWMDDDRYFAQGIDLDKQQKPRQIATITSDAGTLLDTQLLHDLPTSRAKYYIQAIVRMIYGPELLTNVGIRCRAVRHWDLLNFIDYHGVNAVWPKESFDIAKGLRRAGYKQLAADLDRRTSVGLEQAGEFSEFFYVSRNGTIRYDPSEIAVHFGAESPGHFVALPEPGQAWTIAAAINIANSGTMLKKLEPPSSPFEESVFAGS